jgi:hypothetical protein
VSYGSARSDLLAVAETGLFVQIKVGRAFHFLAPEDLETRLKEGPDAVKR